VTAEQVGSYKPALGHYRAARELIGGQRWLHVSVSPFHKIGPVKTLGAGTAWINRRRESSGSDADREFPSLGELARWLT
jgi:FMN phosphatase YigB (HAD superfamily)